VPRRGEWTSLPGGLGAEVRAFVADLRDLVTTAGLTQRELAAVTHTSRSQWPRFLRGERIPDADVVRKLVAVLGVSQDRADEVLALRRAAVRGSEQRQPGPRVWTLPADDRLFVGREEDLAYLDRHTRSDTSTPLVVAGEAGVGKSSLVVRWAYRNSALFPGGGLYADLRGYDGDQVLPAERVLDVFLTSLGLAPAAWPVTVEGKQALYRAELARRPMLIVLDNAATAGQVRPLLPGSTGAAVVVTSRSRLAGLVSRDGATRLQLGRLTAAESAAVLRELAGPDRVTTEPDAVDVITARCEGLPLLLRNIGERAAARPDVPLSVLAAELASAGGNLSAFDSDDPAVSLRSVLSWSYDAMTPDAQRLFRLTAVHGGPDLSLPAVAALTGAPLDRATAVLREVTDVSLLREHEPQRYRGHDLYREYARNRLAADGGEDRDQARRRLLSWYLHTAAHAGTILMPHRHRPELLEPGATAVFTGPADALSWCEKELSNLLAAVAAAEAAALHRIAWQLPAVLWPYFFLRKPWDDWISACTTGLRAARASVDLDGAAWSLFGLGAAHRDLRRSAAALRYYRRALRLWQRLGDDRGQAVVLNNSAAVHCDLRDFRAALDCFQRSLALRERIGDRRGQGQTLSNLGEINRELGNLPEARRHLELALGLQTEIGDDYGRASTLSNLGSTHLDEGRLGDALHHLRRGLELRRTIGDRQGQADTLTAIGDVHSRSDRAGEARRAWTEAQNLYEQLGDPQVSKPRARLRAAGPPPST
jgi:tetratricopeptide (TPR) repeat protein/transcriptional regulator with XRE-family HTH domain